MENRENIYLVFRRNYLRLTRTRKVLVSLFLEIHTPLSVADILSGFRRLRVKANKTTIYRELLRMQTLGIVENVQLGGRKQYFELASRRHHHHLVCLRCERVEDIDMNERVLTAQEQKVRREKQFTILRHSLEFFGVCKMCS